MSRSNSDKFFDVDYLPKLNPAEGGEPVVELWPKLKVADAALDWPKETKPEDFSDLSVSSLIWERLEDLLQKGIFSVLILPNVGLSYFLSVPVAKIDWELDFMSPKEGFWEPQLKLMALVLMVVLTPSEKIDFFSSPEPSPLIVFSIAEILDNFELVASGFSGTTSASVERKLSWACFASMSLRYFS